MEGGVTAKGTGTLYVVSTPIGNMGDFSFRAVEVLRSVNAILAEDTRHTRRLLDHYGIETPSLAYHEHNEATMSPRIVTRLSEGESFALVSDAGTPLVSDPGARLVAAAAEASLSVVPIPGASAVLAALVASGLDVARFTFFGFLARGGSERRAALDEIVQLPHVAVVYESPNRLAATLRDLEERGIGDRRAVVAREMTKRFEEIQRGTVSELRAYNESAPPRGELVLLVDAAVAPQANVDDATLRDRVRALRSAGMSSRDAAAQVARELGVSRRLAYQIAREYGMTTPEGSES